jgi:hypothetical protein
VAVLEAGHLAEENRITTAEDTLEELNPTEELESLLAQESTPQRNRALKRLFCAWAELDGPAALKAVQSLPEPLLRYETRDAALRHWAMANPSAAWDFAVADKGLHLPDDRLSTIMRGVGQADVDKALDFLASRKDEKSLTGLGESLLAIDTLYARGNHDQLISWAEQLPTGALRDGAVNRIIDQWARHNPTAAKEWMEKQTTLNPTNLKAARIELAESWARVNPSQALQWVAALPEKDRDAVYYDRIYRRWLDYDRDAAAANLAGQPPSPALDRSIERYALEVVGRNPSETMPWAESITDPNRRWRMTQRIAEVWRKKDPSGLERYVINAKLSEEQKVQLLSLK